MSLALRCLVATLVVVSLPRSQSPAIDLQAKVDAYFEPLVEMGLFSGAVLVARGGVVLVEKAYGRADIESDVANTAATGFKLMSVSKAITAVAAMRLVQDGVLALDDPVGKYLPDWPEAWSSVTVHDLLDHSAGLPVGERAWHPAANAGKRGLEAWRHTVATLGNPPLAAEPGARHRYDNLNYELTGAVLEAASGKPYRELVAATVFEPVGMEHTGVDDGRRRDGLAVGYFRKNGAPDPSEQDMSRIQAAGGIYSTVGDLYRLDRILHTDELLSKATRSVMHTPKTDRYAVGWSTNPVHGHACLQHSGGSNGYVADFLRFVDEDACVVVLSNFAFAPILRFSHDVAAMLFDVDYAQPQLVNDAGLDSCTGAFAAPAGPRRMVVQRSGKLLMVFDVGSGDERCGGRLLVPLGDGVFATAYGPARLRFRDGELELIASSGTAMWSRANEVTSAWRGAAGTYDATPRLGESVRINAADASLVMNIVGGSPEQMPLVPVTTTTAIALYSDSGGTILHRDGKQLRWTNTDGRTFRFEPR